MPDPAVTDGRYHQVGGPGVWYASDQEQAAWAELFRHFTADGVDPFEVRRRVVKVEVADLEVLDLTDPVGRAAAGVDLAELTGDDYTATQRLASAGVAAGLGGILAPSAALRGRRTLVVLAAGMTQLIPGPSHIGPPPPRLADLLDSIRAHPDVSAAARASLGFLAAAGSEAIRRSRRLT